jgi:hypothetical protein
MPGFHDTMPEGATLRGATLQRLALALCMLAIAASDADADESMLVHQQPITEQSACDQGTALAQGQQSDTRAILFLERCHRSLPSREIRATMHDVRKRVRTRMTKAAPVSLALTPESARATLVTSEPSTGYESLVLLTEDELWLPKGRYELDVVAEGFEGGRFAIEVESTDRILIPITLRAQSPAANTDIDMSDERGAELGQVASTADPRPKEFKTLLAKRYQRAPTPTPIPAPPKRASKGPWPYGTGALAVSAIGTGIVLHVRDSTGPAIAAYSVGALLGGVATYLALREGPEAATKKVSLDVVPGGAIFGISGSL